MNETSLQSSINRYNRKRNSYDLTKLNSNLKNGKKSLPQVYIDLNHHPKKIKNNDSNHQKNKQQHNNHIEITQFNDSNKVKYKTKTNKKDTIILKNLYATQNLKKEKENKVQIDDYKLQIQKLKQLNLKLKQQLKEYKNNEDFLNKKIYQMKQYHKQQIQILKTISRNKQNKMQNYQIKIKELYQQLISIKKKKVYKSHNDDQDDIVICNTLSSQNTRNRIKGQLYSYRNVKYDKEYIDIDKFKRITSPSSHSRGKDDKGRNKWFQQQRNILKKCQQKGQEAYYRTEYLKNNNSQFYY